MPNTTLENVLYGLKTALIDLAITWPPFLLGALKSAHTPTGSQSSNLPPILQSLIKEEPLLYTIKNHMRQAPIRTIRDLYSGSLSYFFTNYMWLISAEYYVHDLTKQYQLADWQSIICAATVGGIISTPGDTLMLRHQTIKRAYQANHHLFRHAKGYLPTILKEMPFTYVALSGVQTQLSKQCATIIDQKQPTLASDLAASALTAPIILLGQPFNRMARVMQQEHLGLFKTNQYLNQCGKMAVKALSPQATLVEKVSTFLKFAYFNGGAYRTSAMLMTASIYGWMRTQIDHNNENNLAP